MDKNKRTKRERRLVMRLLIAQSSLVFVIVIMLALFLLFRWKVLSAVDNDTISVVSEINRGTGMNLGIDNFEATVFVEVRSQQIMFGQFIPSERFPDLENRLFELADKDERWQHISVPEDYIKYYIQKTHGVNMEYTILHSRFYLDIDGGEYDWVFYDSYVPTYIFIDIETCSIAVYTGGWY